MTKNKVESVYLSKIFLKFINSFIFFQLKIKIEKQIFVSFFYWKKQLNTICIFYLFESLLKIRPLIGFYIYVIKKKKIKKIKIIPYFLTFWARWQKAIYWLSRSVKMQSAKFSFKIINELYNLIVFEKSNALTQKLKFYKTIVLFKTSKHFKW
jgi:hypothetical protein